MLINSQDIINNFTTSYFKRGVEYYSQRRVVSYASHIEEGTDDTFVNIRATVRGNGSIYAQDIDIYLDDDSVVIDGNCSCPVTYNCKHVAAVCLSYKTKSNTIITPVVETSLVDKWLFNLETTKPKDEQESVETRLKKEYFLTYRLDGQNSYDKGKIAFYKSKFLKNGSISKGVKLDAYKAIHSYSYRELKTEDDVNIMTMSSSFFNMQSYNPIMSVLSGTLGYVLLKEIFNTNRCYFDYNTEPLRFIDGIESVKYEFKLYKGEYSLKSNLSKKWLRVIETKPALLLNTIENTVQELDLDIATYKQLLVAPKIPKDDIAKVYAKVGTTLPTLEIATPKAVKVKKITTKPKPKIHLKYTKTRDKKSFNSFSVDFSYDEYKVKFSPRKEQQYFYDNDEKIEITRDLDYELSIKKRVQEFGFLVEIQHDDLYVMLKEENRQTQLKLWKEFLTTGLDELILEGWIVETDEEFSLKFEPSSEIVVESEDKNNWFSLSFNLEFNGVSQPIAPLVSSIIHEFDDFTKMPEYVNIEVEDNHFVEVQTKQIQPIINTIIELLDKKEKDDSLKLSPYDAHLLGFMDDDIIWRGSKDILELSQKLKDFKTIKKVKPPKCLNASLRDYQQEGLNWLNFLYEFKFAGILADDMGLGKTIQTLAHLSRLKENKKLTNPSLIVMPTSLIANWKNEAKKFTPNLRVLSLHGSDRAQRFETLDDYDVLLTTYPLIVRDQKKFNEYSFMYIILDEAQKIKNHKTKMAIALKTFKSEYRLALSGTPIENHLGELWSIFSFLMPGFLDTMSFFKNYYQTPIEKEHNFERQKLLNRRVKPFMIRRTKEKVAHELPEKSEIIKYTQFENGQSKLYESIRVTMEKKVQEAVSAKGIGSSHITILDALLKLRQVCCDPSLLKIKEAQKLKESAKLGLFLDLIDELISEGRKILVFSQFTSMLAIIEAAIIKKQISYTKLTGATRKREEAIERFTKGEVDIFLISLKAGGVGLNLTAADTVIHYDPWWNPAVENQATDRAYRIGQKKAVFVYKLIVENSIEEKILEMQKKKQALQDGIYDSDKQQDDLKFSGNELLELLKK